MPIYEEKMLYFIILESFIIWIYLNNVQRIEMYRCTHNYLMNHKNAIWLVKGTLNGKYKITIKYKS